MLRPYLKIWEWELIFGRTVKAISSPGVRSPCYIQTYFNLCLTYLGSARLLVFKEISPCQIIKHILALPVYWIFWKIQPCPFIAPCPFIRQVRVGRKNLNIPPPNVLLKVFKNRKRPLLFFMDIFIFQWKSPVDFWKMYLFSMHTSSFADHLT